jgi:hypothetical protein
VDVSDAFSLSEYYAWAQLHIKMFSKELGKKYVYLISSEANGHPFLNLNNLLRGG